MEVRLIQGIGLISGKKTYNYHGKISQHDQTLNWLQSHLHDLFVANQLGLISTWAHISSALKF